MHSYARLVPLLTVAVVSILPPAARAQGWIQPDRIVEGFAVERLRTDVQIRITDRIARVEVEEWFENRGPRLAEGVYLYPLPGETVFQNYSLFQGDLELTGETMDAEHARAVYEEIVRKKKDPALIELVGHDLLQARVFPIGPGESRRIILRYTQVLRRAGDVLELRYAAGGRGRISATGVAHSGVPGEMTPLTFTVAVEDARAFLDPFSPTHTVTTERNDAELRIRPTTSFVGDFVLYLPPAGEPVRLALSTHRPSSEDGYFMLSLSPGEVGASVMPRDVTLVVDVSGSMSGAKLAQTQRALGQLLGSFRATDRFRLIRFSNGVGSYAAGWTPATASELRNAREWVEGLRAEGGTNISGALEEAFLAVSPEGRLPLIVFLTDGLPTVGERDAEAIAELSDRLRGRSRIFAFGVGYDVDTYLLDRLTLVGRGGVEYVSPDDDVERALGVLAAKTQHPVLADLRLADAPVRLSDVYPVEMPDLFAGEELTLFGRYAGSGTGGVSIRGERSGSMETFSAEVDFPGHETDHDFIPRLWAARKIGELTRTIRVNGPIPEVVDDLRQTALRYGILTEYTSYVVLEPETAGGDMTVRAPEVREGVARVGRQAVSSAAASSLSRAVARANDVAQIEMQVLDAVRGTVTDRRAPALPTGGIGSELRVVSGRAFVLREGIWVDRTHAPQARVVEVQAFSSAYFDLLRAIPELEPWLSAFPSLVVAGDGISIRIAETGAASLTVPELRQIVQTFHAS